MSSARQKIFSWNIENLIYLAFRCSRWFCNSWQFCSWTVKDRDLIKDESTLFWEERFWAFRRFKKSFWYFVLGTILFPTFFLDLGENKKKTHKQTKTQTEKQTNPQTKKPLVLMIPPVIHFAINLFPHSIIHDLKKIKSFYA